MRTRKGWRRGLGMAEIIAVVLVVLPTVAFFLTLMFDYWSLMRLDNQLKLVSYELSGKLNSADDLSTAAAFTEGISAEDMALLQSLCPPVKPVLQVTRTGDLPFGQTSVTAQLVYDRLNHLEAKTLQSTLRSFSYRDQNGSFLAECI